MRSDTLVKAVAEAQRFIDKANALDLATKKTGYFQPRESGAVHRASMDLTRVLADLRQGRAP